VAAGAAGTTGVTGSPKRGLSATGEPFKVGQKRGNDEESPVFEAPAQSEKSTYANFEKPLRRATNFQEKKGKEKTKTGISRGTGPQQKRDL